MPKVTSPIVVAAAVSIAFLASCRQEEARPDPSEQDIETAVRAVHTQMRQAAGKLDVHALYAHVLDTRTPPIAEDGRLALTWTAALEGTTRGLQGLAGLSYEYAAENITVISPTAALWVGEGTASATLEDGRQIQAPFAETILFVERDGEWKALHAHRSTPNPT